MMNKPCCVAGGADEELAPDAAVLRRMRRVAVARAAGSLTGA